MLDGILGGQAIAAVPLATRNCWHVEGRELRVIGCHCQTIILKPSPNFSLLRLQHLQTLCPSITYLLSGPALAMVSSQPMLYIKVLAWWIFFETSQFQFRKFYFERSRKLLLTLYYLNDVNFTHINRVASLLYIFIQFSFDSPHFRWQSLITFLSRFCFS